tara:strand:- start:611 stop:1495 length:885 start_codon:yes stop_codon:yes gene_type:complete
MVRESVHFVAVDNLKHWGPMTWEVTCVFTFQNTTDKAVDVPMGFPISQMRFGHPDAKPVVTMSDFKVDANGKTIATTVKKDGSKKYPAGIHSWSLHFAPQATHVVTTRYSLMGSRTNDGYTYVRYTLTTGSTWKGPIEDVKITIETRDHAGLPPDKPGEGNDPCIKEGQTDCMLPGVIVSGGKRPEQQTIFSWHLRDHEPKHDLLFIYMAAAHDRFFLRQMLGSDGDTMEYEENMPAYEESELRDLMLALYGKSLKGQRLYTELVKHWWYYVDPAFDESKLKLEPDEAKILQRK